ncbi:Hypp59 [Branchiostoma lanceolatum]|uniref:Hypp59 protein n=1 Tax=Branchiostoma lanceolatum TaxID=7740 RepID=A0A8J9V5X2_BRALA|nr:Hypp59 [Branchiostoma lanceolatum]
MYLITSSSHLPSHEVARAATVSRAKVSKLRRQYPDNRDEAAFQMLVHWRSSQAKGNDAFRDLATALESCGFNSVAKVLLRRKESGLLLRSPSLMETESKVDGSPEEGVLQIVHAESTTDTD